MYAVIFRAEVAQFDQNYERMAARLREIALTQYGCSEFTSVTQGNQEIAISYWPDEASIRAWKQNAEHRVAQELGRSKWYKSYRVQIVEIKRDYGEGSNPPYGI